MPYQKLRFKPGFNKEGSNYANEGSWYDGDKIRFRNGRPESIGGYKLLSTQERFEGVCRTMFNFSLLNRADLMFLGTNEAIYIEESSSFANISPIVKTKNLPFIQDATFLAQFAVGTSIVDVNDFPAEPKGLQINLSLGTLESVTTIQNEGFGVQANFAVGLVNINSLPISVNVFGQSSGVRVRTFNRQLTSSLGSVNIVTERDTVAGPIE